MCSFRMRGAIRSSCGVWPIRSPARGKEVWLDTEGIADGEVFPEAIKRAIEQSDAFLFVITPASAASSYCENEVEYAREMQKRIVPVLRDPVEDGGLPARSATATGSRSPTTPNSTRRWSAATSAGHRPRGRQGAHALAGQGIGVGRRGPRGELSAARRRAEVGRGVVGCEPEGADPAPTALQREYLLASRNAAARRQRTLMGASVTVALSP